jgi:regulator of sigma E protease
MGAGGDCSVELVMLAWSLQEVLNIVMVLLGLGLVIFIHELGHFAVAKWCGVKVERFSIGFGPVILKYTQGETEYALSLVPFGGYVKMLGQDDADPSQQTDDRLTRDPRSYTSKTVLQRMAIISAGVFNNMVTAVMFFVLAFLFGVTYEPAVVGNVAPGMPAWQAGLRMGDRITRVGNREDGQLRFMDIRQIVALSHGPIEIEGLRDGQPFKTSVEPTVKNRLFPVIGAEPEQSVRLIDRLEPGETSPTAKGSAASRAQPPLEPGDEIVAVDGQEFGGSFSGMMNLFARKRDQAITLTVKRSQGEGKDTKTVEIKVEPNYFRTLGLRMEIGKIAAIQQGSPAARSELQPGDKITYVITDEGEMAVGSQLDPLRIPDLLDKSIGKEVTLRVKRDVTGNEPKTLDIKLIPEDRPSWVERPLEFDSPVSIPSIGIAYHVLHHVVGVEPGSPADGQLKAGDNILSVKLYDTPEDAAKAKAIEFKDEQRNWAAVFWNLQRDSKVEITFRSQGATDAKTVVLSPVVDTTWPIPMRGIMVPVLTQIRKADGIADAARLGWDHTRSSVTEMYLMLQRLFSGRVSAKALGGPLSIFDTAHMFVKKGFADLILFLGILSVSLAVLNFLPIPVLDGGHFVFLLWEGIRGKPPSERIVLGAQYVGLLMIVSLMAWVMYLDISRKLFGP